MKRGAKIFLIVAAVVVAAIASIPLFVNANTFRPAVEKVLARTMGRKVTVGELSLSVFSGSIVSKDLSVSDDPAFSATPFLTAKELRIGVSLWALLFSGELELRNFRVESPQIDVIRAANGTWNFSSLGHGSAGVAAAGSKPLAPAIPDLSVGTVSIEDAQVRIAMLPAHGEASVFEHVAITVHDFSFASAFPFELSAQLPGGGEVSVKGRAGPLNREDAATSPAQADVSLKGFDPVAAGFLNPEAGVSFVADAETHAASDGQMVTMSGTAHLEKLKLRRGAAAAAKALDVTYRGKLRLKDDSGEVEDASVKIGDKEAHASGTFEPSAPGADDLILNFKIAGQNLPMNELQGLMTAAAVRMPNGSTLKGGTVTMNMAVRGPTKALTISGPIAIENTRLTGFDIGSKIHGIAALSGVKTGDTTEFEKLRANVRMTNAGMAADGIEMVVAGMGQLTGSGTVSAANQLDFNLVLKGASVKGIGKVGVGLLSAFNGASGKSGVPIRVTGTPDDPYITADVGGIVGKSTKSLFGRKK